MNDAILQFKPHIKESDESDFARYFHLLYGNRWLIGLCALAALCIGLAYTIVATPIYRANVLIKVEAATERTKNILGGLGNPSDMNFDIRSAVAAEMEVLRSRSVISRAVEAGNFNIQVQARYFPGIGKWIANRRSGLSTPGLFGYGGYDWGSEDARVAYFNVPRTLIGKKFHMTARGDGKYTLSGPNGSILGRGDVGIPLVIEAGGSKIELLVARMDANAGAQFTLVHADEEGTVEQLQDALNISERGKQSGIIEATLDGPDARKITGILDGISREYMRQNIDKRSDESEKALKYLNTQLPQLKRELDLSESRYNALRNSRGTIDLGEEAKDMLQQSVQIQTKIMELKQKKEELLTRYEEAYPAVVAIDRQIPVLERDLGRVEQRIKKRPEVEQNVMRLNRDVRVNSELYTSLLSTAQQLRLESESRVGTALLLDPAMALRKPVKPKAGMILVTSAALGIFAGILGALYRKKIHRRIDAPDDIEQLLGIPVAANIPHSVISRKLTVERGGRSPMLPLDVSSDIASESFRWFRTSLPFAMLGARNNIIMITGPTAGVGKSFVSANFAVVLASIGKRVLLLDADLRSGHLHEYFGVARKGGLSDVVMGKASLNHVLRNNVAENVDFISNGSATNNPSELLSQENFSNLLQLLSTRYDYILIDTAPILEVSDALVVASHAGAIFNIVRGGRSTAHEVEEATKCLNQAGHVVTGVVLNDSRSRSAPYGYSGAYG